MHKYLTEFLGTFFLVLIIGLASYESGNMAPVAIGCGLMVLVYMGAHVSGAHYNPAVSLALFLRRDMPRADFAPYVTAQLTGAVAASALVEYVTGFHIVVRPADDVPAMAPLILEVLFTFALMLVIFNVAVSKKTAGNSYFGLAIGFTVLAGAYAAGPVSGGAFNPAVGIVPNLLARNFSSIWIYIVGPPLGALLAIFVFGFQEQQNDEDA